MSNGIKPDEMPRFGILVVIYNRSCSESTSIASLGVSPALSVLVVDNSTDEAYRQLNGQFCTLNHYQYLAMNGNVGLPAAYQAGLRLLAPSVDYIMLLDDDTQVPAGCFEILRNRIVSDSSSALSNRPAEIWLPLVFDQKGLLSPCRRRSCLFFRLKQPPEQFSGKMSAINSGMVLRSSLVLESQPPGQEGEPLFARELFLDCVDHLFILKQQALGRSFAIYPARFQQSLFELESAGQPGQAGRALNRFKIYSKDFRAFCRAGSLNLIVANLYLLFRAIKLSLRYRSGQFIKVLFLNQNLKPKENPS
jgi:glycosyltransferase involved in cell wall biosynthesis